MTETYATYEVRKMRGKLVLVGFGRTPRGQRFIKAMTEINSPSMQAPNFKKEMAIAAAKLAGEAG